MQNSIEEYLAFKMNYLAKNSLSAQLDSTMMERARAIASDEKGSPGCAALIAAGGFALAAATIAGTVCGAVRLMKAKHNALGLATMIGGWFVASGLMVGGVAGAVVIAGKNRKRLRRRWQQSAADQFFVLERPGHRYKFSDVVLERRRYFDSYSHQLDDEVVPFQPYGFACAGVFQRTWAGFNESDQHKASMQKLAGLLAEACFHSLDPAGRDFLSFTNAQRTSLRIWIDEEYGYLSDAVRQPDNVEFEQHPLPAELGSSSGRRS